MKTFQVRTLLFAISLCIFTSCDDNSSSDSTGNVDEVGRSFALGFTDFPYANSQEGVADAYAVIERDGDMIVMHYDGGLPWQEALDGLPYPQIFLNEINGKAAAIPTTHPTFLALTPIAFNRTNLTDNVGEDGGETLSSPWSERTFDSPEVITAFTNHCEKMIEIYSPKYFAYAIEANMLIDFAPSEWDGFVTFAKSVYTSLKGKYPNMPIFISLQADFFYKSLSTQKEGIAKILPYTDYIAVSSYPFAENSDVELLAANHFTNLANLAPEKPFAIAETSWPAEDVDSPYPIVIPSDEITQQKYVERLLSDCKNLSAEFVCWFFTRDFDDFWESDFKYLEIAPTVRLWKDTGLYDGEGNPRPSLETWRKYLEKPLID